MKIFVTDRDNEEHELEAIEGWRVMEIIRDYGMNDPKLGIKAECGGACACATCHVYVDPAWTDALVEPTEEEIDMLDSAFEVEENSRLSCQIIMSEELDGLKVSLAPGSEP
jgi:2Fe-2S ferredoxin